MKIKQLHWRHFFGGVALILLIVQLLSGMVLALFYSPHLNEAYASVQAIYNEFSTVAWIRDTHRWAALFLLVAVVMHFIRSFLRKDYLIRDSKTLWLTGMLLYLPMFGFLLTGFILPWEWRGYWFMEMAPNSAAEIPLIGSFLSQFMMDVFTLNRAFVAHVVILPVITLVLMDIHAFTRIKKRAGGLSVYLREHGPLAIPFLATIAVLAYALPMPSQDPAIIPMPLEGENIPTAEWFILIFYVPYLYFKGSAAAFFSIYVPWTVFLALALFPYFLREKTFRERRQHDTGAPHENASTKNKIFAKISAPLRKALGADIYVKTIGALTVSLVALAVFAPLFAATHVSPTMGCNSCHNTGAGIRLGLPPETFKDRVKNPTLSDNTFMTEHWFYPQVVW